MLSDLLCLELLMLKKISREQLHSDAKKLSDEDVNIR